jgi:hypothetical protein
MLNGTVGFDLISCLRNTEAQSEVQRGFQMASTIICNQPYRGEEGKGSILTHVSIVLACSNIGFGNMNISY